MSVLDIFQRSADRYFSTPKSGDASTSSTSPKRGLPGALLPAGAAASTPHHERHGLIFNKLFGCKKTLVDSQNPKPGVHVEATRATIATSACRNVHVPLDANTKTTSLSKGSKPQKIQHVDKALKPQLTSTAAATPEVTAPTTTNPPSPSPRQQPAQTSPKTVRSATDMDLKCMVSSQAPAAPPVNSPLRVPPPPPPPTSGLVCSRPSADGSVPSSQIPCPGTALLHQSATLNRSDTPNWLSAMPARVPKNNRQDTSNIDNKMPAAAILLAHRPNSSTPVSAEDLPSRPPDTVPSFVPVKSACSEADPACMQPCSALSCKFPSQHTRPLNPVSHGTKGSHISEPKAVGKSSTGRLSRKRLSQNVDQSIRAPPAPGFGRPVETGLCSVLANPASGNSETTSFQRIAFGSPVDTTSTAAMPCSSECRHPGSTFSVPVLRDPPSGVLQEAEEQKNSHATLQHSTCNGLVHETASLQASAQPCTGHVAIASLQGPISLSQTDKFEPLILDERCEKAHFQSAACDHHCPAVPTGGQDENAAQTPSGWQRADEEQIDKTIMCASSSATQGCPSNSSAQPLPDGASACLLATNPRSMSAHHQGEQTEQKCAKHASLEASESVAGLREFRCHPIRTPVRSSEGQKGNSHPINSLEQEPQPARCTELSASCARASLPGSVAVRTPFGEMQHAPALSPSLVQPQVDSVGGRNCVSDQVLATHGTPLNVPPRRMSLVSSLLRLNRDQCSRILHGQAAQPMQAAQCLSRAGAGTATASVATPCNISTRAEVEWRAVGSSPGRCTSEHAHAIRENLSKAPDATSTHTAMSHGFQSLKVSTAGNVDAAWTGADSRGTDTQMRFSEPCESAQACMNWDCACEPSARENGNQCHTMAGQQIKLEGLPVRGAQSKAEPALSHFSHRYPTLDGLQHDLQHASGVPTRVPGRVRCVEREHSTAAQHRGFAREDPQRHCTQSVQGCAGEEGQVHEAAEVPHGDMGVNRWEGEGSDSERQHGIGAYVCIAADAGEYGGGDCDNDGEVEVCEDVGVHAWAEDQQTECLETSGDEVPSGLFQDREAPGDVADVWEGESASEGDWEADKGRDVGTSQVRDNWWQHTWESDAGLENECRNENCHSSGAYGVGSIGQAGDHHIGGDVLAGGGNVHTLTCAASVPARPVTLATGSQLGPPGIFPGHHSQHSQFRAPTRTGICLRGDGGGDGHTSTRHTLPANVHVAAMQHADVCVKASVHTGHTDALCGLMPGSIRDSGFLCSGTLHSGSRGTIRETRDPASENLLGSTDRLQSGGGQASTSLGQSTQFTSALHLRDAKAASRQPTMNAFEVLCKGQANIAGNSSASVAPHSIVSPVFQNNGAATCAAPVQDDTDPPVPLALAKQLDRRLAPGAPGVGDPWWTLMQDFVPIALLKDAVDPRDGSRVHVCYSEALVAAPADRDGQKKSRSNSGTRASAAAAGGRKSTSKRGNGVDKPRPSASNDNQCTDGVSGATAGAKRKRSKLGPSAEVVAQAQGEGASSKRQKPGRKSTKGCGGAGAL